MGKTKSALHATPPFAGRRHDQLPTELKLFVR